MSSWDIPDRQRVNPATDRDRTAVEFVNTFIAEHGYGPSIREIAAGIGVRSSSTAHGVVTRLCAAGKLTIVPIRGRVRVKT